MVATDEFRSGVGVGEGGVPGGWGPTYTDQSEQLAPHRQTDPAGALGDGFTSHSLLAC